MASFAEEYANEHGGEEPTTDQQMQCWQEQEPVDSQELIDLVNLAEEAGGYGSDWKYGATLIRDSYFEEYARETAEDLHGSEMRNSSWPFNCIDWERAARELQFDYSQVDFDGETYWARS